MLYEKVTKRCSAVKLSKAEAADSLNRQFEGSEILDLRRRGDKWVATLLIPKTAEFPPSKDDGDSDGPPEKKDSEGSSEGGESDGPPKADKPPSPGGDEAGAPGSPHGGGLDHAVAELTSLVHAIAESMGILPPPGVPGMDDPMGGGGPGGPPPPGGPPIGPEGGGGPPGGPGDKQEIVHKTKLKPGEAAPGVTPIGAPAFSHVAQLQRMSSFDAFDDTPGKSIKTAKDELEAIYGPHGFKVRQIKRVEDGQRLAAKLSRR